MKRCPNCGIEYSDSDINFCLNDGELLVRLTDGLGRGQLGDDSPPTLVMKEQRVTNASNWPSTSPPALWQDQMPHPVNPVYGIAGFGRVQDQTLPSIAIVLGLGALVMSCCFGGIWLGVPAAITGYLGMKNAESDPMRYGGRGMAITGLVLGIITFLFSLIHLFVFVVA